MDRNPVLFLRGEEEGEEEVRGRRKSTLLRESNKSAARVIFKIIENTGAGLIPNRISADPDSNA